VFIIRRYQEPDAEQVGRLIADTYSEFNLSFASPKRESCYLGLSNTQDQQRRPIRMPLPG